ncbi:MAG: hypothetical protein Q8P41_06510 [Pseudomonadota bacterium]|nr:hypothetical protein [Pseudomonadota bacterium]
MNKPQPFVVPAGVNFQITDQGVVIENEGDIVLHTNFGRTLTRIVSTAGSITIHAPVSGGILHAAGDVAIHGDTQVDELRAGGHVTVAGSAQVGALSSGGHVAIQGSATGATLDAAGDVGVAGTLTVGTVRAGGTVEIAGAVKADTLHAAVLRFSGGTLTARGIQGASAVYIGAAKLQVDAILAPEVHLDPHTSGRATVIESQNDLGQNAIKGGFRLADYAEMFGDPTSFLSDRGLSPLGSAAPVAAPVPAPVRTAVPAPIAVALGEPEPAPVDAAPAVEPEVATGPAPLEPIEDDTAVEIEAEDAPASDEDQPNVQEVEGDPATVQAESLPVEEASVGNIPPEHPLHKQLVDAVTRISESYADAELPPAVNHLMSLIETRSYDQVRAEITAIWSDLLKYHQKKGLRIQHQVTTTFNTINSLVKKM